MPHFLGGDSYEITPILELQCNLFGLLNMFPLIILPIPVVEERLEVEHRF